MLSFDRAVSLAKSARKQGREVVPLSVEEYAILKKDLLPTNQYRFKDLQEFGFEHMLINGVALFPFAGGEDGYKMVMGKYLGE